MWLKRITVLLKFDLSYQTNLSLVFTLQFFFSPQIMPDHPIFQYICIYLSRQTHVYVCVCIHTCTSSHSVANWEVKSSDLERGITLRLQDGLNIRSILYVTQSLQELLIFSHFKLFQVLYRTMLVLYANSVAWLFPPKNFQSSSWKRKRISDISRLPGNSNLLHRGLLNCLHGADSHPVSHEEHHQEARFQQPARCP